MDHSIADVLCAIGPARMLPMRTEGNDLVLRFASAPGICRFSVVADARRFDWEELYINLHAHRNKGQRTGPWDFHVTEEHRPLVPSYWVAVDGRRIGLWFFDRVSLDDLAHKRFRGRTAFIVAGGGEHELRLTPYRPMDIAWTSARIETDPDDRFAPLPAGIREAPGRIAAAAWRDEAFRAKLRRRLSAASALYRAPLSRAIEWAMARDSYDRDHVALNCEQAALLIAAHHLEKRAGALERALRCIDGSVARPCWGNPKPDGYSHNGDMHAGMTLRWLAMAHHMLGDEMGEERRRRLLDKLALQGNIFLDLALLNRNYWGGSILQDHGWVSMFAFGAAALHLYGVLPDAARWVSCIIPRLDRCVDAMPLDGVVPPSSWFQLNHYMIEPTFYRDALLDLTGRDLFDAPVFRPIVGFVDATTRREEWTMLVLGQGDRQPLAGGRGFLARMAAKHSDPVAAELHRLAAGVPALDLFHGRQVVEFHTDVLSGFLAHDPKAEPPPAAPGPKRHLIHYPDSCFVHYRDDALGAALALRCGPANGRNGYAKSDCPCDRLGDAPGAGHFSLFLDGDPLLITPENGYRLHTFMRSCMLVDGKGQFGDVGYTMSIPSWVDRGERIAGVNWDAAAGSGAVRLDLKPAYPDEIGMAEYAREILFTGGRRILVRDAVAFDAPRRLSWLFQGRPEKGMAMETDLRARFGTRTPLRIEPTPVCPALRAGIHETEIVWSYASVGGYRPYAHVRYDTTAPVVSAVAEFALTW